MTRRRPPSIRWWEWVFPLVAIGFPLWVTVPALPRVVCDIWALWCGLGEGAVIFFRFDILLPLLFPLVIWALIRTGRLWRRLQVLELEVGIQVLKRKVEEGDQPPEDQPPKAEDSRARRLYDMLEREFKPQESR